MTQAYMIMDMQFGSTGKGLLAGYLANLYCPDTVVTAFAPNAGHTYIDQNGNEYIHRMIGNGVIAPSVGTILLGAGSVIDLDILYRELKTCGKLLEGKRLAIHPQAAVVTASHQREEVRNVKIGSTMKGTGAAIIQRILRDPDDMNTAEEMITPLFLKKIAALGIRVTIDATDYSRWMNESQILQIEGAQGYSLSIYHGIYPYVTSRDVTPAQVLADCCVPYHIKPDVFGTLRTYPIRVANRFDEDGKMIGTSGIGYPDQEELEWADVGVEPELTTVTKLPRRIFSFSEQQFSESINQCAPTKLFLNFANYMTRDEVAILIEGMEAIIEHQGLDCRVAWVGVGATHNDVILKEDYLNG